MGKKKTTRKKVDPDAPYYLTDEEGEKVLIPTRKQFKCEILNCKNPFTRVFNDMLVCEECYNMLKTVEQVGKDLEGI
jgi:hypothetical protein